MSTITWMLSVSVARNEDDGTWVARVIMPSGSEVQWGFSGPDDERLALDVAKVVAREAFLAGRLGPRSLG